MMVYLLAVLESEEELPELRPPMDEIPPGFWEMYGAVVIAGVLLLGVAIVVLVRWLRRPRPVTREPAVERARRSLEALRGVDDPAIAATASRIVRAYLVEAFSLSGSGLTTAELANELRTVTGWGEDRIAPLESFLAACDNAKFAPAPAPHDKQEIIERARRLVVEFETHRAAELSPTDVVS